MDAAIQHVTDHGAVNMATAIRYTAVFESAGMAPPQELHRGGEGDLVTAFMKAFHDRCAARQLPPLDSLVVHVAGLREGHPGAGYFKVNGYVDPFGEGGSAAEVARAGAFWKAQQAAVKAWGVTYRRSH